MTHRDNLPLEASINRYLERHPVSNVVRLEPRRDQIEAELNEAKAEFHKLIGIMEGSK